MDVFHSVKSRRGAFPNLPVKPSRRVNVKSLAAGEVSTVKGKGQSVVRTHVMSLGTGAMDFTSVVTMDTSNSSGNKNNINHSLYSSRDCSFTDGSTTTPDSFFAAHQNYSSDEESNDPYIGRPRRRHSPPQEDVRPKENLEDYLTACTSPETESVVASMGLPTPSTSAMSLSFPKSLQLPILAGPSDSVSVPSKQASGGSLTPKKQAQRAREERQQTYWNTIVAARTMTYGTSHPLTAEAYMACGQAFTRAGIHVEAIHAFKSACRIFRSYYGREHVSVARALDAVGLSTLKHSKATDSLYQARKVLDEAFAIRFAQLGPWHVDTVETYNKIASVHLHLKEFPEAAHTYKEVFLVRKAIFGDDHPSVAIAAHALANVHLRMGDTMESNTYYDVASDIYINKMRLKPDHPTVAKLLEDRKRLNRVRMTI